MRLTRTLALTATLGLLGAHSALATTVDFTSGAWSGATGDTSYSVGDVTLTSSVPDALTFNPGLGQQVGCLAANLVDGAGLACQGDGIGIGDDEIGGSELLTVSFASPVDIFGIDVLDLVRDQGVPEAVQFSVDGITWSTYYTDGAQVSGYVSTDFTATGTSVLYVRGLDDSTSDVALARIDYAAVPEPGTLTLIGMGLAGLAARARRGSKRA